MKAILQARAPGSMMLFGEHAVLRGHPALVCAIDRFLTVDLIPLSSRALRIRSASGIYEGALDRPAADPRYLFVLAAVNRFAADLPGGLMLDIQSDMPGAIGLGSSAAVTVATLAALAAWMGQPLPPHAMLHAAREIIREVQGLGSGADAAASVYGKITRYRAEPVEVECLERSHPLTVVYAGYKTPTADVVRRVDRTVRAQPDLYAALFDCIGRIAEAAANALRSGRLDAVGPLMTPAQGLMDALGVSDRRLAELVHRLRDQPGITGAKISGSGLGDCVVGWGATTVGTLGGEVIPLEIADRGVTIQ